jgi:hypothetical protein
VLPQCLRYSYSVVAMSWPRDRLDLHQHCKEVGDVDHLKVFASEDAANAWFAENDPGGVAFADSQSLIVALLIINS